MATYPNELTYYENELKFETLNLQNLMFISSNYHKSTNFESCFQKM